MIDRQEGAQSARIDKPLITMRRLAAFSLAVLILVGGPGWGWSMDLDDAPALSLESFLPPIELDVAAFDLARSDRRTLCLAASDKTVFLLKVSGRRWATLDVIQPGGIALSTGFVDLPSERRIREPIRFFVSSVQKDGRILTTFYASSKGKTKIEAQAAGRIYRKDGPVLFSQKGGPESPISAELPRPGALPKAIGTLLLPKGTGLFEFSRLSDADAGLTVRIEEDGQISLWSKDALVSKTELPVGRPPKPPGLPDSLRWGVPPMVADVDGDGIKEVVVAMNDPDQTGGFFSRSDEHRARVVCLSFGSDAARDAGKVTGVTPLQNAAITAMSTPEDGGVIVAAVDAGKRRTQLYRVQKTDEGQTREGRRAQEF